MKVPRGGRGPSDRAVKVPVPRSPGPRPEPTEARTVRENRAGMQRANRLALVYSAALLVVFGGLAAYARSAPGGYGPGATADLAVFGGVALLLAAAGVLLSLSGAPRRFELGPETTVVVGRLGGRLLLPPLSELDVRFVRRFPAGVLSSEPTVHVEIAGRKKGRRRAFLVGEHVLEIEPRTPAAAK